MSQRARHHVARESYGERRRQVADEIGRTRRKRDEPPGHADPAVSRTALEIITEQFTQQRHDGFRRRRVQPMTAVGDALTRDLEASGEPTDARGAFHDDDALPAPCEPVRRAEAGWTGAEDDRVEPVRRHSEANTTTSPTTWIETRSPGAMCEPGPMRER